MDPLTTAACTDMIRNDVLVAAIGPFLGAFIARFGAAWLARRLIWRGVRFSEALREVAV